MIRSVTALKVRTRFETWRIRTHYRQFVKRGDLVFDVGANTGRHTRLLADLGCRVVAVEPNPELAGTIDGEGILDVVQAAAGAHAGVAKMYLSAEHVLGTLSPTFAGEVETKLGFPIEREITVPVTTLDELADRYGTPRFVKVDVEGYEAEVFAGMSFAAEGISFEFHGSMLDVLERCLDRLDELGSYSYRMTVGNGFSPVTRWDRDRKTLMDEARATATVTENLYADVSCKRDPHQTLS